MTTAFVLVHRHNGFFVLKEGYEYVALVTIALTVLGILGPGGWALDHALDLDLTGLGWGFGGLGAGIAGSAVMLVASWRPNRAAST